MAGVFPNSVLNARLPVVLASLVLCLLFYIYMSRIVYRRQMFSTQPWPTKVKPDAINPMLLPGKVEKPVFSTSSENTSQRRDKRPVDRLRDEQHDTMMQNATEPRRLLSNDTEKVGRLAKPNGTIVTWTEQVTEKQEQNLDSSMPEWERKVKSSPNWIIVGTIHEPTVPIRTMASQAGWSVCVVADFKTPKDWRMDLDNIVFLSLERQDQLGFKIHKKMPFGIYGRKNMGYMFAIKHGAKVIYDTDDDNELIVDGLSDAFILDPKAQLKPDAMLVYQPFKKNLDTERLLVNPYAHFGQANLWPRGLPLSCLQPEYMRSYLYRGAYTSPGSSLRPLVQQGLANGDPDIDAVYRLTRKRNGNKIDLTFDPDAPAVTLPPDVLAPFNAQNTLYHYDAFWGLMLSVTTTFRVTDIWRSYWMQRVLWDIGGTLSFQIPSVYQDRNEHNYFFDFVEEYRLYNNTADLTKFLLEWIPPKGDLYVRLQTLANELYERKFWLKGDADLMEAWLDDLKGVGYTPPKLIERKTAFSSLFGHPVQYKPREMPTTFVSTLGAYSPDASATTTKTRSIVDGQSQQTRK